MVIKDVVVVAVVAVAAPDGSVASLLTLSVPLAHVHLGVTEEHGGRLVEMRAEVGLLTRDIRVRGTDFDDVGAAAYRSLYDGETGAQVIASKMAHFGPYGFTEETGALQLEAV